MLISAALSTYTGAALLSEHVMLKYLHAPTIICEDECET
jgi:hypothetical protein